MSLRTADVGSSSALRSTTATQTTTTNTTQEPSQSFPIAIPPSGTLRLRAASHPTRPTPSSSESRHIQWAEDVVDNEGMGKKSSKVCCIYHKPHSVDESSDEDDSSDSSSDESDGGAGNGDARPVRRSRANRRRRGDGHDHDHDHDKCDDGNGRKHSPNAYERQPKYGNGKGKAIAR